MARYNDGSPFCEDWTNAKLMAKARELANMESFSVGFYDGEEVTFKHGWTSQTGSPEIADFVRERTRLYRDTWLRPILDEIERRFVKTRKR